LATHCYPNPSEGSIAAERLQKFLDEHGVKHTIIRHSTAFTAQEIAASSHLSGRELAKSVIVKVNGELAMVVLPAPCLVDRDRLAEVARTRQVEQTQEPDFRERFTDCEFGAMPPFGNLHGREVCVDEALADAEEIAFNAGSHRELIRMPYDDFERLVHPIRGKITAH
jgi:Ala-tRNA(Pro) deacylase